MAVGCGTGKAIGKPMEHDVNSAQFSPDGQRGVTAAFDKTAQLLDVPTLSSKDTAEADFQTRRALKLASDNDEVKKLRAEVVKLLYLIE
jgi:hypothetical protein